MRTQFAPRLRTRHFAHLQTSLANAVKRWTRLPQGRQLRRQRSRASHRLCLRRLHSLLDRVAGTFNKRLLTARAMRRAIYQVLPLILPALPTCNALTPARGRFLPDSTALLARMRSVVRCWLVRRRYATRYARDGGFHTVLKRVRCSLRTGATF